MDNNDNVGLPKGVVLDDHGARTTDKSMFGAEGQDYNQRGLKDIFNPGNLRKIGGLAQLFGILAGGRASKIGRAEDDLNFSKASIAQDLLNSWIQSKNIIGNLNIGTGKVPKNIARFLRPDPEDAYPVATPMEHYMMKAKMDATDREQQKGMNWLNRIEANARKYK